MNRTLPVSIVLLLSSTSAFGWWGDDCEFRADRSLDIDARALAAVEVLARAGDLEITGDPERTTIEVRGKACAGDESLLAGVKLVERRDGDRHLIEVVIPEGNGWADAQASMDLVVRVPARLGLEVQDSSGDLRVEGVASLRATDSSGDLHARAIAGDVRLRDSSGDLIVRGVAGSVFVDNDSSGDITIVDVQRDVIIEEDSSGGIRLHDVRGSARVKHDSSGDIEFARIGGDAEVTHDSSGDIDAVDVTGAFTVKHDSTGDIDHRNVGGKVSVPAER
jgi:hypothetical protein